MILKTLLVSKVVVGEIVLALTGFGRIEFHITLTCTLGLCAHKARAPRKRRSIDDHEVQSPHPGSVKSTVLPHPSGFVQANVAQSFPGRHL